MARFSFLLFSGALTISLSKSVSAQPLPDVPFRPNGALPPTPSLPGFGAGFARSPSADCAVTGLAIAVHARRTAAVVDVGVRVKAIRGGLCSLQPQAIQLITAKSIAATRLVGATYAEGRPLLPMTIADAPGGVDRPLPWANRLAPGAEKTVIFRSVVEGEVTTNGDVDAPARVRVDLSQLGARLVAGAPLDVRVALEPSGAGRVTATTGNLRRPAVPQVTGPNGSLLLTQTLGKDDFAPQVEWRYETEAPGAVASAGLAGGGLPVLEYLRDGLARDLTLALADAKNVKRVGAGWDTALTTAYVAAQSKDPLVAGLGIRALAWLASGLSFSAIDVKGATETAREGTVLPDELLADVRPALSLFTAWSGRPVPPAPLSARSLRTLGPKFGEPGSYRKEADDALKRLAKNRDTLKSAVVVGEVVSLLGVVTAPTTPAPKTSRLVDFGPKGTFFVEATSKHAIRESLGRRAAHGLRRLRPRTFLLAAVIFGTLIGLFLVYAQAWRPSLVRKTA